MIHKERGLGLGEGVGGDTTLQATGGGEEALSV